MMLTLDTIFIQKLRRRPPSILERSLKVNGREKPIFLKDFKKKKIQLISELTPRSMNGKCLTFNINITITILPLRTDNITISITTNSISIFAFSVLNVLLSMFNNPKKIPPQR